MKTEIEIIETSTSPMTVELNNHIIQLQTYDSDRLGHGGLNITKGGYFFPVPKAFSGQVFMIKNNSGNIRDGEVGFMVLAANFAEAVEYVNLSLPLCEPSYSFSNSL
jgi:hypothetical protein